MSYKASLIKLAIKWTPKFLVVWVANLILKGIAELKYFAFDVDTRKAYVALRLLGETEDIEVWAGEFFIVGDEEGYKAVIGQARSNKLWLNNVLAHVVGKAWKIPEMPQWTAQIRLAAELFGPKS